MKKLGDIIDDARDGKKPEYDDLRHAVCAMESLMTFDRLALHSLADAERNNKKKILLSSAVFQSEERFERIKRAYNKSPKEWLGPNNDPDCKIVQERRGKSLNLVNKIMNKHKK